MDVMWVIQRDDAHLASSAKISRACQVLGVPFQVVEVVPFSLELPTLPSVADDESCRVVFFGQTTLMRLAYASNYSRGVFFDPCRFRPSTYLDQYGEDYLNVDGRLTTIEAFAKERHDGDEEFFIKPDDDLKLFAGGLDSFENFIAWAEGVVRLSEPGDEVTGRSHIFVAAPKQIDSEYRLVMVDGKCVSCFQYQPSVARSTSVEIQAFAERCASRYSPSPIFVLDIAKVGFDLKVIEANCFNASGIYGDDATEIVRTVTAWLNHQ